MYQALYRKWRPRTFSEVVGQAHITETLQRQVAEGHTAHAYLFTGTRGTGKTTCARILAKAVNCLSPVDGAPCCRCEACLGIENGTLLDVTELDAASNNGVDQVRALREEAVYTPAVLRKRVYIIDEVHMLSTAAFNALLKILEEPPEHLLFILATTELHKVPATILSRCQRFSFKRILPRDLEQQLQRVAQAEGIDLQPDGAEILARMANGALRDALSLLDQCRAAEGALDSRTVLDVLGLAGSVQTAELMGCLLRRDSGAALALFDRLYRGGKDVGALLGELSDLSRDLMIWQAAPEGGLALLSGVYDSKTIKSLSQGQSAHRFLYFTSTLQSCCAGLSGSLHPRTDGELCLLRLCDEALSGDLTALVSRVERLEQQLQKGVAVRTESAPRPAEPVRPVPPAEEAPPIEEERPPLPEEPPRERYAPPPPAPAPQKAAGSSGIWGELIEQYKGRLPVNHRVFLNMASGVLEGDVLTVNCQNDFVLSSLNNSDVLTVLKDVTSQAVGQSVRVMLQVGAAPKAAPAPKRAKTEAPPPPSPKETPPWEESAPADRLEEIVQQASRLEHFQIK